LRVGREEKTKRKERQKMSALTDIEYLREMERLKKESGEGKGGGKVIDKLFALPLPLPLSSPLFASHSHFPENEEVCLYSENPELSIISVTKSTDLNDLEVACETSSSIAIHVTQKVWKMFCF